jgi:hypothetical protein
MIKRIANKILNVKGEETFANKVLLAIYLLEIIALASPAFKKRVDLVDREFIASELFKDQNFIEQIYSYFKADDFALIGRSFDFKITEITHARSSIFYSDFMGSNNYRQ